jgi:hypothetical protein
MRSNRRRNWFIKRIALGFAVAALVAPAAQAKVDQGGVSSGTQVQFSAGDYGMPRALPSDYVQLRGDKIELIRSLPRTTGSDIVAADYGMPRAMPSDYALSSGDQIEVVRAQPRGNPSDKIEFVRSQPRSTGEPQIVATGFNWDDAVTGAGLALLVVLLGGAGAAVAGRHLGKQQTV